MSGFIDVFLFVIVTAGGALIAVLLYRQRSRPSYPEPGSYILRPELADDRILALEGGVNFRDIGGYATHDGHFVRWGQVYRTGALSTLTPKDWQQLDGMGLQLVCDLRSAEEAVDAPDNISSARIRYQHLPLKAELDTWKRMRTIMFSPSSVPQMLIDSYTEIMIDQNPAVFGQVLCYLADEANRPAIIHCTAGKDRTGVTIALLLSLLGVSDDIIAADYTLSNGYFPHFYAFAQRALAPVRWLRVTADDIYPLLVANAETIKTTLHYVRARYGTVEVYLRDYAGVDESTQARLREMLLTDNPAKPGTDAG